VSKGDIVISIKPKFVARILAGEKAAELRRRAPRIQPGCKVWIYTKAPEATITVCVTVDRIVTGSPVEIWEAHEMALGVSRDEFECYFADTESACAILFSRVQEIRPVSLSEIRAESKHFQPPQFFKRLHEGSPELRLFRSRLAHVHR
jgi:predicted transcriptional regulator